MAFTINSGAFTAAVAIAGLLTFFLKGNNLINNGILITASKLYANSFMGMLNARKLIRHNRIRFIEDSYFGDLTVTHTQEPPFHAASRRPRSVMIQMQSGEEHF